MIDSTDKFITEEVPGFGPIRGPVGSATLELAGAAAYWHRRHRTARMRGFACGVLAASAFQVIIYIVSQYWP